MRGCRADASGRGGDIRESGSWGLPRHHAQIHERAVCLAPGSGVMLAWPQRSQLASGRARRTANRQALSRTEATERNVRACCQPAVFFVRLRCLRDAVMFGRRGACTSRVHCLTACEGLCAHVSPRSPSRARARITGSVEHRSHARASSTARTTARATFESQGGRTHCARMLRSRPHQQRHGMAERALV